MFLKVWFMYICLLKCCLCKYVAQSVVCAILLLKVFGVQIRFLSVFGRREGKKN